MDASSPSPHQTHKTLLECVAFEEIRPQNVGMIGPDHIDDEIRRTT
jgi:hypothetical protein